MTRSSKGLRGGTRRKFRSKFRSKFTVTPFLKTYEKDQRVIIKPNPISPKSMPHWRFIGITGVVKERRGDAYVVEIVHGDKKKTVIARPEHLAPA